MGRRRIDKNPCPTAPGRCRISPLESNSLILLLEQVSPRTWHALWITTSKTKLAAQLFQFRHAALSAVAQQRKLVPS